MLLLLLPSLLLPSGSPDGECGAGLKGRAWSIWARRRARPSSPAAAYLCDDVSAEPGIDDDFFFIIILFF